METVEFTDVAEVTFDPTVLVDQLLANVAYLFEYRVRHSHELR
jgi:hypothetical protein